MKKKGLVENSFLLGIDLFSQMKPYIIFRIKNETTNIPITFKTDIRNVSFIESHYLVRWSLRYSFEWKIKPQASQLTYKNDFRNLFFPAFGRRGSRRYFWPRNCPVFRFGHLIRRQVLRNVMTVTVKSYGWGRPQASPQP